jgi:LL-diaminopimelate aminotransferase
MAGWRVGFAAGSAELCGGLDALKHNLDASIFSAIQLAAAEALDRCEEFVPRQQAVYRRRRDLFCGGLEKLGWRVERPKATFYVWIPTPEGMSSADASARLLEEAEVLLTPGAGFGPSGEGYLRAALVQSEERLAEAVERIGRMKW